MTTAITGKQATFTYGAKSGTAQVVTSEVSETATSETIQTYGGSVALSQGTESEVSCDFLYDGNVAGGFYGALKAALDAGSTGALLVGVGADSEWSGDALVTELSAEIPADGAVTCSAVLTISGALAWTDVP